MADSRFPRVTLHGVMPYGNPQYLPGSPMRLPDVGSRLARPEQTIIGMVGDVGGVRNAPIDQRLQDSPAPQFVSEKSAPVRDPHHYATINSLNTSPGNGVSAIFLQQAQGRRNFLAFRNVSVGANIYIEFGRDANTNSVFKLAPTAVLLFDVVVPQDDVYAYADAVGASLSYSFSNIN